MSDKSRNDILDLFAVYKVFDVPDGLIDSLALYVDQRMGDARHECFRIVSNKVDEIREKQNANG